jgi:hypothetical protein
VINEDEEVDDKLLNAWNASQSGGPKKSDDNALNGSLND